MQPRPRDHSAGSHHVQNAHPMQARLHPPKVHPLCCSPPTHSATRAAYRSRLLPAMPIQPRLPWPTASRHARPATPTVADCFPPCPSNTPKAAKLVAAPGSSSQVLCAASSHLSSPCVRVRVYVHLYVCTHMRVCVCVLRCVRAHVDTFVVQAASRART